MPSSPSNSAACVLRPAFMAGLNTFPLSTRPLSRIQSRYASSQPSRQTKQRALMWAWLNGPGSVFRHPKEGSTNYLGAYDRLGRLIRERDHTEEDGKISDKKSEESERETAEDLQPFPLNPYFRSQPVLSEELKDEIYKRVVLQKKTVREVSQQLHVEMRRVAAVVRLKTVEQDWTKLNKPLAKAYARAITGMLPTTPYSNAPEFRIMRHESINDLPVHESTLPQVFQPVPESRRFTRVDAGKAFHRDLLPADARIPHPDMIDAAQDADQGLPQSNRVARRRERFEVEESLRLKEKRAQEDRDKRERKVVSGKRWDFVFREMDSEANAGKDGRNAQIGWRYGFPLEDRKKGMVKIPTSVK